MSYVQPERPRRGSAAVGLSRILGRRFPIVLAFTVAVGLLAAVGSTATEKGPLPIPSHSRVVAILVDDGSAVTSDMASLEATVRTIFSTILLDTDLVSFFSTGRQTVEMAPNTKATIQAGLPNVFDRIANSLALGFPRRNPDLFAEQRYLMGVGLRTLQEVVSHVASLPGDSKLAVYVSGSNIFDPFLATRLYRQAGLPIADYPSDPTSWSGELADRTAGSDKSPSEAALISSVNRVLKSAAEAKMSLLTIDARVVTEWYPTGSVRSHRLGGS